MLLWAAIWLCKFVFVYKMWGSVLIILILPWKLSNTCKSNNNTNNDFMIIMVMMMTIIMMMMIMIMITIMIIMIVITIIMIIMLLLLLLLMMMMIIMMIIIMIMIIIIQPHGMSMRRKILSQCDKIWLGLNPGVHITSCHKLCHDCVDCGKKWHPFSIAVGLIRLHMHGVK